MSEGPRDEPGDDTWGATLLRADHWLCLDAAMAMQTFARLLEEQPDKHGNAAVVWLQASELFRTYTRAWESAGAASRWDHDFRQEGDEAAQQAAALMGGEYSFLDPPWLNSVVGGQAEQALADALAEIEAGAKTTDLTLAGRRVLAQYCRAAGEHRASETLLESMNPPAS